jgi:hypothetical protein
MPSSDDDDGVQHRRPCGEEGGNEKEGRINDEEEAVEDEGEAWSR